MDTSVLITYLKRALGPNAQFKEMQLEAIQSVIQNHFSLVVQKTGWGKSMVYFIATRYFRDHDYGPTIIVSPLISLMRNQIDAAARLSLNAEMIIGKNVEADHLKTISAKLSNNLIDILYITPEQLCKDSNQKMLLSSIHEELALFVIDEVHCISEWGHDFRPAFSDIKDFVNSSLISNKHIHILATTATANDFVINDIKEQFKCEINTMRGPLIRESLNINIIHAMNTPQRYAWILSYLKNKPGSGIIYCLTVKDCNLLAMYLSLYGINAVAYHSELKDDVRKNYEADFYCNRIKVLVATTALGMGYDKPDIAFVIHFQSPKSMLEYYQQIGRAGRNLENADAILMVDTDFDRIVQYFISHAFPNPSVMHNVLQFISNRPSVKMTDISNEFNLRRNDLELIIKHLVSRKLVVKDKNSSYFRSFNPDNLDEYIKTKERINQIRKNDLSIIKQYFQYRGCYMEFISRQLNDIYPQKCGKCANCRGITLKTDIPQEMLDNAVKFVYTPYMVNPDLNSIKPRVKFPFSFDGSVNINKNYVNEVGYYLARYNYGLGARVASDKYQSGSFSSFLVEKMSQMIVFLLNSQRIVAGDAIVYVPSLNRPDLVRDFAFSVAQQLNIPCYDAIVKIKKNSEQKTMQNSELQFGNIISAFMIDQNLFSYLRGRNVYLIDDMVDSKWTITVCGYLLKRNALVKSVTPLVLADSSNRNME